MKIIYNIKNSLNIVIIIFISMFFLTNTIYAATYNHDTALEQMLQLINTLSPEEIEAFEERLQEELRNKNSIHWESVLIFIAAAAALFLLSNYGSEIINFFKQLLFSCTDSLLEAARGTAIQRVRNLVAEDPENLKVVANTLRIVLNARGHPVPASNN